MTQKNETPKVYGNRTCRNCKGICHKNSYRQNFGERKVYYCSETCLRNATTKNIQKRLKENGSSYWMEFEFTDNEWDEHLNQFYEKVFVITK